MQLDFQMGNLKRRVDSTSKLDFEDGFLVVNTSGELGRIDLDANGYCSLLSRGEYPLRRYPYSLFQD